MSGTGNEDAAAERPLLRVVRGAPTPDELAALVAVVAARASGAAEPEPARTSPWASRAAQLRQPLRPGPGAWAAGSRTR